MKVAIILFKFNIKGSNNYRYKYNAQKESLLKNFCSAIPNPFTPQEVYRLKTFWPLEENCGGQVQDNRKSQVVVQLQLNLTTN